MNLLHPLTGAPPPGLPPTRERGPPNTLPKSTQSPTSLTTFLTQLPQLPLLITFPSSSSLSSSSPKTWTLTAQLPTFFTYSAPSLFFVFLARSRTKNGKHHLVIIIFILNTIVNLTILGIFWCSTFKKTPPKKKQARENRNYFFGHFFDGTCSWLVYQIGQFWLIPIVIGVRWDLYRKAI